MPQPSARARLGGLVGIDDRGQAFGGFLTGRVTFACLLPPSLPYARTAAKRIRGLSLSQRGGYRCNREHWNAGRTSAPRRYGASAWFSSWRYAKPFCFTAIRTKPEGMGRTDIGGAACQ